MSRLQVNRTACDTYRVLCQHCGSYTEVQQRQLSNEHRKFRITCECGYVSRILCERRLDERKPVQIDGYLFALGTKEQRDDITVVELSIQGLQFTTQLSDLQVGDQFTVGFFLNDASAAWVEQDIEICHVRETRLFGAEFVNPELYSVDLDFYLMNVEVSV